MTPNQNGRVRVLAVAAAGTLAMFAASASVAGAASAATGTGVLEVCKQVTPGSGLSGSYSFTVRQAATGQLLKTVSVAVGGCSGPLTLPAGNKVVSEVARAGSSVSDISVSPAARTVSTSLTNRQVRVQVPGGTTVRTETLVTFTNTPTGGTTGQLKVCKQAAADSGSLVGRGFSFRLNGGSAFTVAAGAAGSPNCSGLTTYPVGTGVTVSELATAGTHVSQIVGAGTIDYAARTAGLTIHSGIQVVTYTNQNDGVPQTGYIEVCKEAADAFTTGSFGFTIAPSSGAAITRNVLVGQCTNPIQVPAGNVTVTEAATANSVVDHITVDPGERLVASNLVNRTVTVSVPVSSSSTDETLVTYYNRAQLASLKVCKTLAPNSGDLAGRTFLFNVTTAAGATNGFAVVAGGAGETTCRIVPSQVPIGSSFAVSELGQPNVLVTGVAVVAASGSGSGAGLGQGGSASGTLASGVNTVTFTNQAYGTLEVCKNAADSSVTGGFQFSVNGGSPITVNAGQCSPLLRVPAGPTTVLELARANFSLVGVTATGPAGENRVISGFNPVTVSVPFGGAENETLVTFTNRTNTAILKICKATNYPALVTGSFDFQYRINPGGDTNSPVGTLSLAPGQCQIVASGVPVLGPNGAATTADVLEMETATTHITDVVYEGSGSSNADANSALTSVTLGQGVNVVTYVNDPRVATPAA